MDPNARTLWGLISLATWRLPDPWSIRRLHRRVQKLGGGQIEWAEGAGRWWKLQVNVYGMEYAIAESTENYVLTGWGLERWSGRSAAARRVLSQLPDDLHRVQ